MGWIQRLGPHKYKARYRARDKRERAKTFQRKSDASRWLADQEARLARGTWTDPRAGRTPFRDAAEQFEAGRVHLRPSTRARDETLMRTMVLPRFGDYQLGAVLPSDIQAWVSELSAQGRAAETVRKAYQLAAGVLDTAVDSALIPRSPCRRIKLPEVKRTEMRFLELEEIHELADAIGPRYRGLVLLAGYSGARFGELAGLQTSNVNVLRRTITITHSLTEVRSEVARSEPKTPAARRTIALPAAIAEVIGAHLGEYPATDGYVFTSADALPIRRTNFRRRDWLPAVRASVGEPCRFHDLRHSHVALLIAQGEHPKTIASRLGHKSVRTVLDVYGHLYEGLDQAAAERLNSNALQQFAASVRPAS